MTTQITNNINAWKEFGQMEKIGQYPHRKKGTVGELVTDHLSEARKHKKRAVKPIEEKDAKDQQHICGHCLNQELRETELSVDEVASPVL
ncbi:hypothetical protein CEXT_658191 [Caerostris extrusa]|uniref:Transposase n=1 Tax=Caerostris extrusa TaxID=172846 RepID=A0AAV4S359_CAEEX|nr:hypothetical protein CEXT_658191 [Caerostris extrusa]